MKSGVNTILIGALAILAFGIGIWFGTHRQDAAQPPVIVQDSVITVLPKPKKLKEFVLQETKGTPFTLASLKNHYSIVFFGYTSCPDVCPTTLLVLSRLYKKLEQAGESKDIQVVFVSVDPKRDNAKKLEKYVSYFNKAFIGVTGKAEQIAVLAGQLGASYKVNDQGKSDNYEVDHTGLMFVVNPDGEFAAILSPPHDADLIRSRLKLLKQIEKR